MPGVRWSADPCDGADPEAAFQASDRRVLDLTGLGTPIVEARRGPFRYDLLFEPSDAPPLAIEIVVSAPVGKEKFSGSIPVLEIQIQDEQDLVRIEAGLLDEDFEIRGVGLDAHFDPPTDICAKEQCVSRCLVFSVSRAGRVRLLETAPFEAVEGGGQAYQFVTAARQAFSLARFEVLDRLSRQAYFEVGAPVRACLVCRHHELRSFSTTEEGGPVRCALDGKFGPVNRGAGCVYFTPFSSIDEARKRRLEERSGGVVEP